MLWRPPKQTIQVAFSPAPVACCTWVANGPWKPTSEVLDEDAKDTDQYSGRPCAQRRCAANRARAGAGTSPRCEGSGPSRRSPGREPGVAPSAEVGTPRRAPGVAPCTEVGTPRRPPRVARAPASRAALVARAPPLPRRVLRTAAAPLPDPVPGAVLFLRQLTSPIPLAGTLIDVIHLAPMDQRGIRGKPPVPGLRRTPSGYGRRAARPSEYGRDPEQRPRVVVARQGH